MQVVCVRDVRGRCDPGRSMLLQVGLLALPEGWCDGTAPEAVGWEANAQGKLAARCGERWAWWRDDEDICGGPSGLWCFACWHLPVGYSAPAVHPEGHPHFFRPSPP